jgi:hypothetical protein
METAVCNGAGLGLRPPHLHEVCRQEPAIPWFEVHICNYLGGGLNRALLHKVAERYPLSFHGVNLNLGGVDPLDRDYLTRLAQAIEAFQPALVSEHACFTAHGSHHFHDLLPVPYTEEAAAQLRYRSGDGTSTLYEVAYDPVTFGAIPSVERGEPPSELIVKGLRVSLWVEKGLLMVLVETA